MGVFLIRNFLRHFVENNTILESVLRLIQLPGFILLSLSVTN
jgi:hypothetical protein